MQLLMLAKVSQLECRKTNMEPCHASVAYANVYTVYMQCVEISNKLATELAVSMWKEKAWGHDTLIYLC